MSFTLQMYNMLRVILNQTKYCAVVPQKRPLATGVHWSQD
jgi:hypothetical protein